jgi:hypothetical protein
MLALTAPHKQAGILPVLDGSRQKYGIGIPALACAPDS